MRKITNIIVKKMFIQSRKSALYNACQIMLFTVLTCYHSYLSAVAFGLCGCYSYMQISKFLSIEEDSSWDNFWDEYMKILPIRKEAFVFGYFLLVPISMVALLGTIGILSAFLPYTVGIKNILTVASVNASLLLILFGFIQFLSVKGIKPSILNMITTVTALTLLIWEIYIHQSFGLQGLFGLVEILTISAMALIIYYLLYMVSELSINDLSIMKKDKIQRKNNSFGLIAITGPHWLGKN